MPSFLILDDSPGKMEFLRRIVLRAKWPGEILTAVTTEEACALIDAHAEIGASFIDYYVPEKNGPSVIRYLTTRNPQARIALVSSSDSEANAEEARTAGATAVVCASGLMDFVERRLLELLEEWSMNV
jgi:DNA-binding NarL/FixJ family response regulator